MILMVTSTISCVLNLSVFFKESLRKNPCTIYLIAINILNLFYFYWAFNITIITTGYGVNPGATNLVFCRFLYYISIVLSCWKSSYFILASIDRIMITSPNAATRLRSTRRLVITSLITISLFWAVVHTHIFVYIQILHFGPFYSVCYYRSGAYTTFMTVYFVGISGILVISLMTIFGL
ncbi:unnamed protein product [Rotaria sp. Silwood2]|nr:unnamed protein product [Rotaria sp. Silwood2]CAF4267027.1 unnamed protein product [Rotaria sp. Silwood2]